MRFNSFSGGAGGGMMPVADSILFEASTAPDPLSGSSGSSSDKPKIRQSFPETWIWATPTAG